MFLNRIKLLINRYLKARSFGFLFFAARYFYIPKSIKINNKIINLNLPDEYGVKITFVEIFLDDTYKLDWIKKFAKKKNIDIRSVLDVGGNCGLTSMLLRSHFSKSVIHCYEPNLEIISYLKYNAELLNFDYYNEAVGDKKESVKLNISKNDSILSHISSDESGATQQISFDRAFKRFGVDNLDIVKMDCEGSEWEIFNHIEIWKKVKFLTMEYHLGENNFDHNRIVDALNKIGFKLITKLDNNKNVNYGMVLAYNTSLVSL